MALRTLLAAVCACLTLVAQGPNSDYTGVIREGSDLLLELGAGAAGPADRIELKLNKATSRDATLEYGPEGWTASSKGPNLILEGPALTVFPALFRVRIGEGKTPTVAHLRAMVFGASVGERDVEIVHAPPAIVSVGLDGLLALPPIVIQGESALARPLIPRLTSRLGTWRFNGEQATTLGEAVRIEIPFDAETRMRLEVRYEDPWRRTTLTGEAMLQVEPPPGASQRPRVDAVQATALGEEALTVCGWFPPRSRDGVLLDGKPVLEVAGGSMRSLILSLPGQAPPGRHFISGDPDLGFPDGILAFELIVLDTTVDRAMQPPQTRIKVLGTERPVRIRAVNLDPLAASLAGGESQIVETDGGRENIATIAMAPSEFPSAQPRDLNIVFTLAEDRGACAMQGIAPTSPPGARVAN